MRTHAPTDNDAQYIHKASPTSILISIVIPVYNGISLGLKKCLDHIWTQALGKDMYEVICVDDCSKDKTKDWIRNEQQAHDNLILIENEVNLRQGGARNVGVLKARGKYLMFIDQDDFYADNSLQKVRDFLLLNNLDILVCDSVYCFKDFIGTKLQLDFIHQHLMTSTEFVQKNGFVLAPWRLVVNREFYINNKIRFVEKCRIEDVDWACRLIYYAQRIQYQPILLLYYIKSNSGTTDNMYRHFETLMDNALAGKRTYDLADTIYKDSTIRENLIGVADMYFNFTCKYLFGMYCSINKKVNLISIIPEYNTKYKLVRYAKAFPYTYSMFTTCCVPIFRALRIIKRKIDARNYSN